MWLNPQYPADLVTFTEEILNGKLHFLCSVWFSELLSTWPLRFPAIITMPFSLNFLTTLKLKWHKIQTFKLFELNEYLFVTTWVSCRKRITHSEYVVVPLDIQTRQLGTTVQLRLVKSSLSVVSFYRKYYI